MSLHFLHFVGFEVEQPIGGAGAPALQTGDEVALRLLRLAAPPPPEARHAREVYRVGRVCVGPGRRCEQVGGGEGNGVAGDELIREGAAFWGARHRASGGKRRRVSYRKSGVVGQHEVPSAGERFAKQTGASA